MPPPDEFLCKVERVIQPTKNATLVTDVSDPYICLDQHDAEFEDMYCDMAASIVTESNFIWMNCAAFLGAEEYFFSNTKTKHINVYEDSRHVSPYIYIICDSPGIQAHNLPIISPTP